MPSWLRTRASSQGRPPMLCHSARACSACSPLLVPIVISQLSSHTRSPVAALAANRPSNQWPPSPSAAPYTVSPLTNRSVTYEKRLLACLVGIGLLLHGSDPPSVVLTAPIPTCAAPLIFWKRPPMRTRSLPGAIARANTSLSSAVGRQVLSLSPLEAFTAARRVRDLPLTLKKFPPKYTVEFVAAMPRTMLPTFGSKASTSAPVAVSNAASRLCCLPSTSVNSPPTYTRLPSGEATIRRP